ncbi:YopX family protein [Levilactobacillus sp. LN180102]|uniref:YopX family protein n=1 Tax=Levilactobacillus sp. LN180102 TaxID=3417635 RepID=UPI003CF48820
MVPKFRAWDVHEKRMLKVYRLSFDGPIEGVQVHCYLDDRGAEGSTEYSYDGDGLILDQYTGLKDANGKEIYEMDILEYYYVTHGQTFYDPDTLGTVGGEPGIETTVIGKVAIWPSTGVVLTRIKAEYPEDFDSSNLDVPKMLHVNKHFTIIGNVHENLELLEAQHDTRTD